MTTNENEIAIGNEAIDDPEYALRFLRKKEDGTSSTKVAIRNSDSDEGKKSNMRKLRKSFASCLAFFIALIACIALVAVEMYAFWSIFYPGKTAFGMFAFIDGLINIGIFAYITEYIKGEIYHK